MDDRFSRSHCPQWECIPTDQTPTASWQAVIRATGLHSHAQRGNEKFNEMHMDYQLAIVDTSFGSLLA